LDCAVISDYVIYPLTTPKIARSLATLSFKSMIFKFEKELTLPLKEITLHVTYNHIVLKRNDWNSSGGESDMSKTIEAIFENGVLRPLQELIIPEHQRLSITINSLEKQSPQDIIRLADQVFAGLSQEDVVEIEKMALNRTNFFREVL
jgi:predicted DNA-binding antitoxin AbrB/MazE fold protein